MFRSSIVRFRFSNRCFSNTAFNLKKRKDNVKKEQTPDVSEAIDIDKILNIPQVTEKFDSIISKFQKHLLEIKLGKSNPNVFNNVKITIDDKKNDSVLFTDLASTSLKGRNFIITVFDPKNSSKIINSILNLNYNAQIDSTNNYTIKVPLPPINTESKQNSVKLLKKSFENFKSGPTSLASIRHDIKTKLSKVLKLNNLNDTDKLKLDHFEKIHKSYNEKLLHVLKKGEVEIMK